MRIFLSLEAFRKDFIADLKFIQRPLADEDGAEEEPQPQGDVYTSLEHAHSYSTEPEMHVGSRPDFGDDEARRTNPGQTAPRCSQPIGFKRNPS